MMHVKENNMDEQSEPANKPQVPTNEQLVNALAAKIEAILFYVPQAIRSDIANGLSPFLGEIKKRLDK